MVAAVVMATVSVSSLVLRVNWNRHVLDSVDILHYGNMFDMMHVLHHGNWLHHLLVDGYFFDDGVWHALDDWEGLGDVFNDWYVFDDRHWLRYVTYHFAVHRYVDWVRSVFDNGSHLLITVMMSFIAALVAIPLTLCTITLLTSTVTSMSSSVTSMSATMSTMSTSEISPMTSMTPMTTITGNNSQQN